MRRLVTHPGQPDLDLRYRGLRLADCAAAKEDTRIARIAAFKRPSQRALALFDHLGIWEEEPTGKPPSPPARRPAPLEVEVTDDAIRMAGPAGLPRSDANERAALGWEALREHRGGFERVFPLGNHANLRALLADFDEAMGQAYDPRNAIRIGVQGERLKELADNRAYCDEFLPADASALKALASAIDRQVRRFPDWIAYPDDAEPDDTSPAAVRASGPDFRAVEQVLETTPEAEAAVKAEYAAEVEAGTGRSADEPSAKAIVASTGEVARAIVEKAAKDRERWERNRELSKLGGDFNAKAVLGPLGLPLHVMKRLEAPLRNPSKRSPNRVGWLDRRYDLTFGPEDPT